jgi:hypothetical protein
MLLHIQSFLFQTKEGTTFSVFTINILMFFQSVIIKTSKKQQMKNETIKTH